MAAGLGFKDFTTGEVLTAADVDGYLMQGIWVFASAAARDAAVTSPQEGNFAYLKDTNTTTYYTGSAWTNLDTTGMVNPMTTTGDTIYSSSGSTPARLGIGSTGQVLTVAGGIPSWATPAAGGRTLLSTTTLSGASTVISSIPSGYVNLQLFIVDPLPATTGVYGRLRINGDTNTRYTAETATQTTGSFGASALQWADQQDNTTTDAFAYFNFYDYANTTTWKTGNCFGYVNRTGTPTNWSSLGGNFAYNQTAAITSLTIYYSSGNITSGTAYLYGVK